MLLFREWRSKGVFVELLNQLRDLGGGRWQWGQRGSRERRWTEVAKEEEKERREKNWITLSHSSWWEYFSFQ